jgi:hypothetical protein
MEEQEKSVTAKRRVVTSFEIGELKEPWEAYCKANGVSSGEALCRVILKLTNADKSRLPKSATRSEASVTQPTDELRLREGTEKKRHRLYLSLTQSELKAVERRAKADGFDKSTAWAIALIRTNLTSQPQFGTREIDVLGESNRQLLLIGRNLNQIAHALNVTPGKSSHQYDAQMVEALAIAIKKHVKRVGDALRASVFRWTLE